MSSEQIALNIPNSARKMKITMIAWNLRHWKISMSDINSGKEYFQVRYSEGRIYHAGPARECMSMLRQSDVHDFEAHIVFWPLHWTKYGKFASHPETAQMMLETFSQEVHSIAHLWANGRVTAELYKYPEHESQVLPLSEFCDELFSQDRSILACKVLMIDLYMGWPLSVVSNVAHCCRKLMLKEAEDPYDVDDQILNDPDWQSHSTFLNGLHEHSTFMNGLYEMRLPQHISVIVEMCFTDSVKEYIDELKKRFQRSVGQRFKYTLLSPHKIANMTLRNKNGSTLMIKAVATRWNGLYTYTIEQRSRTSASNQQQT